MKYIKYFYEHDDYTSYIANTTFLPNLSYCEDLDHVHFNKLTFNNQYFTTIARENGTISFNIWKSMNTDMITSISYSTDNGATWTTTANQNDKEEHLSINVNVEEGDKILWKGTAQQLGYHDADDYADFVGSFFSSDCEFDAKGNVMSLIYGDNFDGEVDIVYGGQFACLFHDYDDELSCMVVNAKDLSLPATTLASNCYQSMFSGCTSLVTAPVLPATTLASDCYGSMFYSCTSLVTAPVLPATTLASDCYSFMFNGCTSLVTAPVLPATTMEEFCYDYMFSGCTSLVTAPVLPATTLASSCYARMFSGCTSLVTAPVLPATTLASNCYDYMFAGCTSLNYIKAMFTTTPSTTFTQNWVNNVAASGTFVKNSAASWNVTGNNGVPSGWTVETASN